MARRSRTLTCVFPGDDVQGPLGEGRPDPSPSPPGGPLSRSSDELRALLRSIDGRGYRAYRALRGRWALPGFELEVQHVQGDPYAAPSRVRVHVPAATTGLDPDVCASGSRAIATGCCLARRLAAVAAERSTRRGSGRSGGIEVAAPGQEVLRQTAVQVSPEGGAEARFRVGLPARGRRVRGDEAVELLLDDVPRLVSDGLRGAAVGDAALRRHADVNEDADALRSQLAERGLVAFVADGAVLPRRSGADPRPLQGPGVVPFRSPDALRATLETPHAGPVTGMGVPQGITLIVGGGYHGKSTLLDAIASGVYNHRPGDGREQVVADGAAVAVHAEDGRAVAGVDISAFIGGLPSGVDTRRFSTANASGSTSQASGIAEALEVGARALLIDEDTAATNFLIRDRRMQALVPREDEPITPFIDRVRWLHRERGVSSVLVLGGCGDYFDVADRVIALRAFQAYDATESAKEIARRLPTGRSTEAPPPPFVPAQRVPAAESFSPARGRRGVDIRVRGRRRLEYGTHSIDLSRVDELVQPTQTRAVGQALVHLHERSSERPADVSELLDALEKRIARDGLDVLDTRQPGDLAGFRRFAVAAALNRIRGLALR